MIIISDEIRRIRYELSVCVCVCECFKICTGFKAVELFRLVLAFIGALEPRGASAAVVVYDQTNAVTFERAQEWVRQAGA